MDLNSTWFILIAVLFAGYAMLDGFDLGVGILHLFFPDNHTRRLFLNSIGPVWDGNEVWLLTGGGALFAAFPIIYATVFSAFYIALMLLLFALIFRAVSLEFRGKVDSAGWRRFWDWSFGLGSLIPALLFGVAFGNIMRGIPLNEDALFTGSFIGLLNPFSLLIGLVSVTLFIMHGAGYLLLKVDGVLYDKLKKIRMYGWAVFLVLFIAATLTSKFAIPHLLDGIAGSLLFWLTALITAAAIIVLPLSSGANRQGWAFLASCTIVVGVFSLAAIDLFPVLTPSITDEAFSLTAYNASSTPRTLKAMLIIALIGMPFVIGYTIAIYRVFKGKVVLNESSY